MNIAEEFEIKKEYFKLANEICQCIIPKDSNLKGKMVIAVAGESGSGKSTTAISIEREFAKMGISAITLHMDSYFKLPPKDNHKSRVKDLENVGPQEVNITLLNEHISAFKNDKNAISIPIVNYIKNKFTNQELVLSKTDVLLIEGVYSFLLRGIDKKVFMSRNYHDTFQNRIKRTRENHEPIIESILEIEHKIVSPMIKDADFVIDKDYTIRQ